MEEAVHIDVHTASASNSTSSRQTQAVDVFSLGCVFYTVGIASRSSRLAYL